MTTHEQADVPPPDDELFLPARCECEACRGTGMVILRGNVREPAALGETDWCEECEGRGYTLHETSAASEDFAAMEVPR